MIEAGMLGRLRPGDHACVVVDDDGSRLRSLATYVSAGLRDDERILYFGPDHERLAADLVTAGVDAPGAIRRGQLEMVTAEESYLASGTFHPESAMAGWRVEAARARADGFRSLRAIGDMSWAARPRPGADRLAWYEANVNRVFAERQAMAICLYDRRLFSPSELQRMTWAHPAAVDRHTGADVEPALRFTRVAEPPGIRLQGEVDLANRQALRAVLENLAEDTAAGDRPLIVDVSDLRFADSAAVRILLRAAVAGAPRMRVAGCTPGMRRLLAFNGAEVVV
ncbi:MEDS domain-containing protein [Actinoplanes sp. NPDC023801]|uniref:MEDS domain-containing protein n=1 Tax=Actinoplanes sp. NPDC023801 TaxID=3154595 RepID=UPI0033C6F3B6